MTLIGSDARQLIYALIMLAFLHGCTTKDECAQAVASNASAKSKNYKASAAACRKDYAQTRRETSLLSLVTSLGELADWAALEALYAKVEAPVLKADAMMIGAKYQRYDGQAELAHEKYLKAINVYRQFERPKELGIALHHAFRFVWRNSDHKAALSYAGEGLQIARRYDNKNHEVSALSNLAKVFQEVGSVGVAQHALNQQKPLLVEHAVLGQQIDAHINQGLVYLDAQKFGLAAFSFEKALRAAAGSGNRHALRALHLNLVSTYIELDRLDQADAHLQQAWEYADSDGSRQFALNYFQSILLQHKKQFKLADASILKAISDASKPAVWDWEFLYQAGAIARDLGDAQRAIQYFREAITASDKLRESIGFNNLKAHLLSRKRQPYEALFLSYFDEGNFQEAFTVAEQAKSKSFIEAYLHNQEASSVNDQGDTIKAFDPVAETQRIDDLLQHLELMQSSPVLKPHSAQELLLTLDQDQIVSFFVAQERVFAMNLSQGSIAISELDISFTTIKKMVQQYKSQPNDTALLARLGAALLKDFDVAHPATHVYVSPDDLVSEVAFASLRVGNKFLVELKSISLIPSAGALFEIQSSTGPANRANALVLGNPNGDLPSAQAELREVAKHLKTNAITGDLALSSVVLESSDSSILHLATHSGVNQLGPWIRFADGDVSAKRIARRGVATKLAVLASCSSAAKQGKSLWGSLGGLFLSSGTPSVFVTQWSVKDDITRGVVSQFYQHFIAGQTAAESLALVQRLAIDKNKPPSEWAAYALLGN